MFGWTPNKGQPMKGQTSLLTMQLPNQRPGKPDKLSQNAGNPDKLSHNAMQNTLNKKGLQSPKSGGQAELQ